MTTREEVYRVIDGEREYQDEGIASIGNERMHETVLGEDIAMLQCCLDKARRAWYDNTQAEPFSVMHEIRKIAGIAVASMEKNGAPPRLGRKL